MQRALERYRIPKGVDTGNVGISNNGRRLFPIFRDREELASAADLSESIRDALSNSNNLIVVCSPQGVASQWVGEEIRYFKETVGGSRIFCLLVSGVPEPGDPQTAFPAALLESKDGALTEPLAADVRPGGDGKRVARLKIAAGLLDVGVDELRRRDAQRRLRLRTALTAASVFIAVVMLGLAILAQIAREESEVRRVQAERLINFMLGELRTQLEPVGRLDVLDSVGDEAMSYFEVLQGQGTDAEQLARAMALRQIGEVRFRQGRLPDAQDAFEASLVVAQGLRDVDPSNENYIYQLGQAEFWVGYAALEQSDLVRTASAMQRYMQYSQMLVAACPDRSDYVMELAYAYSNLGTLALKSESPQQALQYFRQSTFLNETLVAKEPGNLNLKQDLANGYSWLGAVHLQQAQLKLSLQAYDNAVKTLAEVHEATNNPLYAEHLCQNAYHLADVLLQLGKVEEARQLYLKYGALIEELVLRDPENAIWRGIEAINRAGLGELMRALGESDTSLQQLNKATDSLRHLARDDHDHRMVTRLALAERSMASLMAESQKYEAALELSTVALQRLHRLAELGEEDVSLELAMVEEAQGRFLHELGQGGSAAEVWGRALQRVPSEETQLIRVAVRQILHRQLGLDGEADRLKRLLTGADFLDPRYPLD